MERLDQGHLHPKHQLRDRKECFGLFLPQWVSEWKLFTKGTLQSVEYNSGSTEPATPKIGGTNTTYLYSSEILIGAGSVMVHKLYEDESADFQDPNPLIRDRAQNFRLYDSLFNKPVGLSMWGKYTIRVTSKLTDIKGTVAWDGFPTNLSVLRPDIWICWRFFNLIKIAKKYG